MQSEVRVCPKCSATTNQMSMGFNRSGSQRCKCGKCGITYTAISRSLALKAQYSNCDVTFSRLILDGKQHFIVNIANTESFGETGTLYIYRNSVLYDERQIVLSANGNETIVITFDELDLDDFVYIAFLVDGDEIKISDNYATFFSLLKEYFPSEKSENPYKNTLSISKSLLGGGL